jgi:hypothetical protein
MSGGCERFSGSLLTFPSIVESTNTPGPPGDFCASTSLSSSSSSGVVIPFSDLPGNDTCSLLDRSLDRIRLWWPVFACGGSSASVGDVATEPSFCRSSNDRFRAGRPREDVGCWSEVCNGAGSLLVDSCKGCGTLSGLAWALDDNPAIEVFFSLSRTGLSPPSLSELAPDDALSLSVVSAMSCGASCPF